MFQARTPLVQDAVSDDHHKCKWSICTSRWKEKHHQRKLQRLKNLGKMQELDAATKCSLHKGTAFNPVLARVLPGFGCCISFILDSLHSMQLIVLVFFLLSTGVNTSLVLVMVITDHNVCW